MEQSWIGRGTLLLSVGLHAFVLSQTGGAQAEKVDEKKPPTLVHFTVPPLPEPEPVPDDVNAVPDETKAVPDETKAVPDETKAVPDETKAVPDETKAVPDETKAVPDEAEASPSEISGTTLVAEGEGDFSAPGGTGGERDRIFRAPSAKVGRARKLAQPKEVKKIPLSLEVVPVGDLKRRPAPPALGGALKHNYPDDARKQGRSGEAKIKARIEKDGRITLAQIAHESSDGFGQACRKTLLNSQWTAPLDKQGAAVATWITYRCKFRIDD